MKVCLKKKKKSPSIHSRILELERDLQRSFPKP